MASFALPTIPSPRLQWRHRHAVSRTQSPFTGRIFVEDLGADWWELTLLLPPMRPATAASWYAWVANLDGGADTFPMVPPGESAAAEFRLLGDVGWSEHPAGLLILFEPIRASEVV